MVDLIDYQQRGDLNAPFERTKKHEQAQGEAVATGEAVHCEVTRLIRMAYVAGEPCPGCGLPYRDDQPWAFKGTMHFTEEERARYDAEESPVHRDARRLPRVAALRLRIADHALRQCCPSPPPSPTQLEEIARILSRRPTPPDELMRWRLRKYCGHVVEKRSHFKNATLHSAFTGSKSCDQCGLDPATIVDGEAIGLVEEAQGATKHARATSTHRAQRLLSSDR